MLRRLLMVLGALTLTPAPAAPQVPLAEYAERRAALAARLDDGVFIARGGNEPVPDYIAFHQSAGFRYLTGLPEAGAALLMTKRGGDVRWSLFVQRKVPSQEVWSGARLGAERAAALTGIPARHAHEFSTVLDSALHHARLLHVLADIAEGGDTLNRDDRFLDALRQRHPTVRIAGANGVVAELRGRKSAAELELLRKAIAISMDAHREAMRAVRPGMHEFELQALVEYTFRRNGAERPAYASIVGSGENATTLHYNRNDRRMRDGELVVMDVGARYRGYAADLTRTFPVGGTFSAEQRALYQVVRDAQAAAERNARPGMSAQAMSDSASAVIAAGLTRVGLIESPRATYDCGSPATPRQCLQAALYYMHGLGHGIGLDVHDPDQYERTGVIAPGSAFTLEPGIYVRANLLDIIPGTPRNRRLAATIGASLGRYAGIGIRIEDNYVVTADGLEWVSCGLPREVDEIEAMMREGAPVPPARDAARVGWYGATADGAAPAPPYVPPSSCVVM